MTVCSGASQAKPGVASSVIVDAAFAKNLYPPALAWLYDYLPLMRTIQIDSVSGFCASDPPSWTLPSSADLFSFVTGGYFGQGAVVEAFLENLTKTWLWYSLCECASGPPTPVVPPVKPSDLPAINPFPLVSPNSPTPCRSIYQPLQLVNPVTGVGGKIAIGPTFPLTGLTPSYLRVTFTQQVAGVDNTPNASAWYWTYDGSDPTTSGTATLVTPSPANREVNFAPAQGTYPLATAPVSLRLAYSVERTSSLTFDIGVRWDFYCGGNTPATVITPCCPPDLIAQGLLRQILTATTLLQRQLAPFAYVYGANHSGLTGDGELSVQGVIGASVDVTTRPSQLGEAVGTPLQIFDVGWITFGTADGWESSRRIDHEGALVLPGAAGAFTRIGYTLHPGVVVSIRELLREP